MPLNKVSLCFFLVKGLVNWQTLQKERQLPHRLEVSLFQNIYAREREVEGCFVQTASAMQAEPYATGCAHPEAGTCDTVGTSA